MGKMEPNLNLVEMQYQATPEEEEHRGITERLDKQLIVKRCRTRGMSEGKE